MVTDRYNCILKFTVIVGALLLFNACSDFTNKNIDPIHLNKNINNENTLKVNTFSEHKMLVNLSAHVIFPKINHFLNQLERIKSEVVNAKNNLTKNKDVSFDRLKMAWLNATLTYHQLEAMPVVPVGFSNTNILKYIYGDEINFSACAIDNQVLALGSGPVADVPNNILGLIAIEYLAYEPTLTSNCPLTNGTSSNNWNNKSQSDKKIDRLNFALLLIDKILDESYKLKKAWDPQSGDYVNSFANNSKDSLAALVNSFYFLEKVKEAKLNNPMGGKGCFSDVCPELLEHKYSKIALEAVKANIEGFQQLYFGITIEQINDLGFDDFLNFNNRAEVNKNFETSISRSLMASDESISLGSFEDQLVDFNKPDCESTTADDRKVKVCGLYQSLKILVVNNIKVDLLTALSLSKPGNAQGDSD